MRWTVVAITVSVFTSGTSLASDADPPSVPSPWYPYPSGKDGNTIAGSVCAFPFAWQVVDDEEMGRTLAVDASGRPTLIEVKGDLIMRYIHVDTGKSVIRHVDGHAFLSFQPDGSQTMVIHGPFYGLIKTTSTTTFVPQLGLGAYIWSGTTVVEAPPRPKPATLTWAGPIENLCDTLGGDP